MKIPKLNQENQKAAQALVVYLTENPGQSLNQVRIFLNSQKEKLKEFTNHAAHYKNYKNILSYLYLTYSIRSEKINNKRFHYANVLEDIPDFGYRSITPRHNTEGVVIRTTF